MNKFEPNVQNQNIVRHTKQPLAREVTLTILVSGCALVVSGIFQISRNPMYVGMTFLLLSWTLFLSSPYTFIGAVILVLYINRVQIQRRKEH